ncbi:MAG: 23S rRNA (guanosine(2251)-2'-O)-methyltransferase RlmB [Rhabdaerophilum sp.]
MTQDRTRHFHPLDQRPREDREAEKPVRGFKDKSRFAPKPRAPKAQLPDDTDVLYGMHSVKEALANPRRRFRRLLATENALQRLVDDSVTLPLEPQVVKPEVIGKLLTADAVHQGIYLEAERLPLLPLDKLPQDKIILALDQVTDPHNVGAILRSAAAFGVGGIIVTHRHSPEITGVLAKAASGALEHVPMAGVQNLARALTGLKEQGFKIIGLDSEASDNIADLKLAMPLVLVLGAEGRGLRPSTRELCDHLARLELPGAIKSLNVSNAAAISLYAVQQATRRS